MRNILFCMVGSLYLGMRLGVFGNARLALNDTYTQQYHAVRQTRRGLYTRIDYTQVTDWATVPRWHHYIRPVTVSHNGQQA